MISGGITLVKCDLIGDWYTIERKVHDNSEWWEITSPNSRHLMMSKRLNPEACVEGTLEEMSTIAQAIKSRTCISHKRCAVEIRDNVAYFWSPRNSEKRSFVPIVDAEELAEQIEKEYEKTANLS